jgi:hypothetical protein
MGEEGQAPMNELTLKPTPRSLVEKVYDANVPLFLAVVLLMPLVLGPLTDALGYWPAVGIGAILIAVVSVILSLPVIPLRRRRVGRDAEQGIFECVHREQGTALKGRWARGYAKAEPGRLLFQAKTGLAGSLTGSIEIYAAPALVGVPVKAPWSALPRGRIATLKTDRGTVDLAATPASIDLLVNRFLGGGTEQPPVAVTAADGRSTMVEAETKRSLGRYWTLVLVAFAAAFVVGLAVAYLSVWIMGGRMGEIQGVGKYVAIVVSLVCACAAYAIVLRQAFKFKPTK